MSDAQSNIRTILENTQEISGDDFGDSLEQERRSYSRRKARWNSSLALGKRSVTGVTREVSERMVSIDTSVNLTKGTPVIVDIRSVHNGASRTMRVCGFVRYSRMFSGGFNIGVSVVRIAEGNLLFLRDFTKHKV